MQNLTVENPLKDLVCLNHVLKIIVPSETADGCKIDSKMELNKAIEVLSDLNGGATCYEAYGGWKNHTLGVIQKEAVTVIESFTDTLTVEKIKAIIELAKEIKEDLQQEAVSIYVNGALYFV